MATPRPLLLGTTLVIWIIFGNLLIIIDSTSGATFGENCDVTSECDPGTLLTCNSSNICACQSSERHIFDHSKKACVTKLGLECGSGRDTNCVTNARCSLNTYRCSCREGYFENSDDGTCIRERTRGESCSKPEECSDTLGLFCLIDAHGKAGKCQAKRSHGGSCTSARDCASAMLCLDGTCGCDTNEIYDPEKMKCTTLVGYPCEQNSTQLVCVQNAQCVASSTGNQRNGRCVCMPQYIGIENGTCVVNRGHGESCSEEEPCYYGQPGQLQLVCSEGRCVCKGHTEYDVFTKKCRRLIGELCSVNSDCISSGKCDKSYREKTGKCVCKDHGTVPDDTGLNCLGGKGYKCNSTRLCNPDKNLVCRQHTCQCPSLDHDYYDDRYNGTKKCLTLVGGPCEEGSMSTCVGMAECTIMKNSARKVCRCKTGYIPVDRHCYIGHGQPCEVGNGNTFKKCDKGGRLQCLHGTCQCAQGSIFDEKLSLCRGLVGSKCDSRMEACVEGAVCEAFRSMPTDGSCKAKKAEGICECGEGYLENTDGRCNTK